MNLLAKNSTKKIMILSLIICSIFSIDSTPSKNPELKFFTFNSTIYFTEIPKTELSSINIPFNYPFELKFHPDYALNISKNQKNSISNKYSAPLQIAPSINFKISESKEISIETFETKNRFDSTYYVRDSNTRLPSLWQLNSANTNSNSGVVFTFLKNNFAFYTDFSVRFLGLESAHSQLDSIHSNLSVAYNIENSLFPKSNPYRLSYVLQYNNSYYTDDRLFGKKIDLNKKSHFFSQGFTVSTKSAMFEGLIRVPTQIQTTYDIDGLWKPEVQGRLGVKWNLPEYIKP